MNSLLELEREAEKLPDTAKKILLEYWDDGLSIHYFLHGNVISANGFTRGLLRGEIEQAIQLLIDKCGEK